MSVKKNNKHDFYIAGIPEEAIATTLPTLGYPGVRNMIVLGPLQEKGTIIVVESPVYSHSNTQAVDLLTYTMAKETLMTGKKVACINLATLCGMFSKETEDKISDIPPCDVLFVMGILQEGATFISPSVRQYIASYLLKRVREGGSLVLSTYVKATHMDSWWPSYFCGHVQKYGTVVGLERRRSIRDKLPCITEE